MSERGLEAALDLMKRLPPSQMQNNLSYILQLVPHLTEPLLEVVDQPLTLRTCVDSGREFIESEFNRDGDSYRSPWSNTFDPPLPDGNYPPERLRNLEIRVNNVIDAYREQYYRTGVSSVYAYPTQNDGFALAVLIKKDSVSGERGVEDGTWNSIHVVDVSAGGKKGEFVYSIVTTVIVFLKTDNGKLELGGTTLRRKSVSAMASSSDADGDHITNIGNLIQDIEGDILSSFEDVSFSRTSNIVNQMRSPVSSSGFRMPIGAVPLAPMLGELSSILKNRKSE